MIVYSRSDSPLLEARSIFQSSAEGQWMLRYSPLAQEDDRAVEEIPIQERLQAEQAKLQSQRRDSSTMRKRLYHGSPQLPHGLTYGYA